CASVSEEEEEGKNETDTVEGMEISTRSKGKRTPSVSDVGSGLERVAQKRKVPSPSQSSNGHSSAETTPSPSKKKRKPGPLGGNKDQSELRHGPFYYAKQPALNTDPVDTAPQDGRNDFYCWLCHREGQVLCCELCPRVYHAKCLKLPAEPEGDWFCPECEKITVAECIETQSKAMTMLTIDQLSFLLKFALQKMKQPGTEPFQKPVSLEQHPDYAEYIFHAMDLCTLEKNIKKKMYGCTEAFLADAKWILHNCIIYNGGNHKLTATAKVIVKICEHEMNEIEVCPECYLSACQKRDNWFCEPCVITPILLSGAWVPLNNCYLMSKEIPFSVKKTKSIFNSAMQEMEVYVENMRKKISVFNYAPFRTPYTPDNNFQMLLDPSNPSSTSVKPEKQEKIKMNFDMTMSPKVPLVRSLGSGPGMAGGTTARRVSVSDLPRSPMSTNSSAHTCSDGEQESADKPPTKGPSHQYSTGEESMDCTASSACTQPTPISSSSDTSKPFRSPATGPPVVAKQEKPLPTASILNLNLDRSKAEMDLKELSETVQQRQGVTQVLTSPKRQIKSRFQLNLDKTIESCKAQLGIDEISEDVYKGVEHSDSEESDKSDSSDSEDASDEERKPKDAPDAPASDQTPKELSVPKVPEPSSPHKDTKSSPENAVGSKSASDNPSPPAADDPLKDRAGTDSDKRSPDGNKVASASPVPREKPPLKEAVQRSVPVEDSDSERELVIDLGEEQAGKEKKRARKDNTLAKSTPAKAEGKSFQPVAVTLSQSPAAPSTSSSGAPQPSPLAIPVTMVPLPATSPVVISAAPLSTATLTAALPAAPATPTPTLKKQRPLLPRETVPVVQRAVVWNPTTKFQTSSQKWHMQKVQRQQLNQQPATQALAAAAPPLTPSHTACSSSSMPGDVQIPIASADVAADIAKYTNKIMDAIKGTMTEIYNDLSKSTSGNTVAEIRRLRIEIEKLQWLHQQELSEMKHNLELTMAEMRQSLEQERERLVAEVKKQMEVEKQQAVDETKKKQWCANCRKEAIFYCCWNTSYCDYPCQQAHWPEHMKSCTQSATAPQQEVETEPATEGSNKSSGPPNSVPVPLREPAVPPLSDKDSNLEKSSETVSHNPSFQT
uniref:Zinc finger, MYND-type containing 8 n=1 Tax=Gadus morhua TaxID=8049 RepID=A0A8C5F9D9_GADMO